VPPASSDCFPHGVARGAKALELPVPEQVGVASVRGHVVGHRASGHLASGQAHTAEGLDGELV
jgi:hypothetical protein